MHLSSAQEARALNTAHSGALAESRAEVAFLRTALAQANADKATLLCAIARICEALGLDQYQTQHDALDAIREMRRAKEAA